MYFYDIRLVCNLLGIESVDQLRSSQYRGSLFENSVVLELVRQSEALGKEHKIFYWRDSNQKEIDLIVEKGGKPLYAMEVKSSATYRTKAFDVLNELASDMGLDPDHRFVVYGGDESLAQDMEESLVYPTSAS